MRTIPMIRQEMLRMAKLWEQAGFEPLTRLVREWEADLHRRKPIRRARPNLWGPTPEPYAIMTLAAQKPHLSYMQLATELGCSIGRVSEALAGQREAA